MLRLNYAVDVTEATDLGDTPIRGCTWYHPATGMPMHVVAFENGGHTVVLEPGAAR